MDRPGGQEQLIDRVLMAGICGWVGELADAPASGAILDAMLRECGAVAGDGDPQHGVLQQAGIRFGCLGGSSGRLFADDRVAVAVTEAPSNASRQRLTARDLATLYLDTGQGFLEGVRGSFSLALFDRRENRLILAVDRAGIRPLYVWQQGEAVAFASRLAAFRCLPGFVARIHPQGLFDYLYFHVVPSPGSIYSGCEKLLPAQRLSVGASGRRSDFYWSMPYRDENPAPFAALRDEFRALLPRVVERAADTAGAVGAFLSGGTDSSTVAGTLCRTRNAPVRTYSMGFEAEGFDEMAYARIAARHFGTEAREYYVTPADVLASIPRVAAYCDEPFGNASVIPAYLCARFARADGIERMLAGDGGDEIFGGNARYADQWVFELYGRLPRYLRSGLIEPIALRFPGGERLPPLRKIGSYIEQAKIPLPDRLETYNFLHRTPLGEIFDPQFLATVDPAHPLDDLREVYRRTRSTARVNRMMHLDLKITLADNDLRKVNQACALAGVGLGYPLLDDEMLEFAARVPPRLQVRRTRLRWFFRQALADFLPAEILAKKKHGFGLPAGLWMAEHGPLRELTQESVAAFRRRGILNPAYLDWIERQHRGEHASYYGVMLWVLVMLEQWLQQHGH